MAFGFGNGKEKPTGNGDGFDARGTGDEGARHDKQTLLARLMKKLPGATVLQWLSGELNDDDIINQYKHLDEE